ncbi:MAG: WbuC family cupin fold metalloprotein [Gammaproteobacteria bacterium]
MGIAERIDKEAIETLKQEAQKSSRRRAITQLQVPLNDGTGKTILLSGGLSPFQFFSNAIEPNSYVRPHKHPAQGQTPRFEIFLILQGKAKVILFSGDGTITDTMELSRANKNFLYIIPPNTYHSVVTLEKNTVLMEFKNGYYDAETDKKSASWSPSEQSTDETLKQSYIAWMKTANVGDKFTKQHALQATTNDKTSFVELLKPYFNCFFPCFNEEEPKTIEEPNQDKLLQKHISLIS